jgi:hypothetical protein
MFKSKKWLIISVVTLAMVVVVGVFAGVAYAQTPGNGEDGENTFAARVAEILGIEQQQVEDAFQQAREEMRDEAMNARLDKLVEDGKLTQEQADEYKDWIESRPDVPVQLGPRAGKAFRGMQGCGPRGFAPEAPGAANNPAATGTSY